MKDYLNPNQVGGGADLPLGWKNLYTPGTKSPIDLKPGCKFKFVRYGHIKKKISVLRASV